MNKMLIVAAAACVLLYTLLSGASDAVQKASRNSARQAEAEIASISQ